MTTTRPGSPMPTLIMFTLLLGACSRDTTELCRSTALESGITYEQVYKSTKFASS